MFKKIAFWLRNFLAGSNPTMEIPRPNSKGPKCPQGILLPSSVARWVAESPALFAAFNAAVERKKWAEREERRFDALPQVPEDSPAKELDRREWHRRAAATVRGDVEKSAAVASWAGNRISAFEAELVLVERQMFAAAASVVVSEWSNPPSRRYAGNSESSEVVEATRRRVVIVEGKAILLCEEGDQPVRKVREREDWVEYINYSVPELSRREMAHMWDLEAAGPVGSIRIKWATDSVAQFSDEELAAAASALAR